MTRGVLELHEQEPRKGPQQQLLKDMALITGAVGYNDSCLGAVWAANYPKLRIL